MSSSGTQTASETYSVADIENVVRRFTTDLRMIAESSGALAQSDAEDYGEDIEYLAKKKLLEFVDITLFVNGEEEKAVRYTVNTSGDLTPSRPGGVLWPRKSGSRLSIVVRSTQSFWLMPNVMNALNISWGPTIRDLSHSTLKSSQGRAFVSNGFAFDRKDYSK
jgi:Bacterial HORMA domain family 1